MFPPDSWPPVPVHLLKVVLQDNEALQRVKHPRYPSRPMSSPGCQDPEPFSESVPGHSHWCAGLPHPELSVPCLPGVRSHAPRGGALRRAAAAPAWRLPHTLGTAASHGASPCPPPPLRPSFLFSIPQQPGLGMIWGHLGERERGGQAGQRAPQAGHDTSSLAADTPLCHAGFTINHHVLASLSLTLVMAQAQHAGPSPANGCSLLPAPGHRGASGACGANGVHAEALQPGYPLHRAERGAHRY